MSTAEATAADQNRPSENRGMSTKQKAIIGVILYILLMIALVVFVGSEGKNEEFQPQNEFKLELQRSAQVGKYATDVDRESARESLARRVQQAEPVASAPASTRARKPPPTVLEQVLKSPTTRTIAGAVTRGIMGALLGGRRRR